LFFQCDWCPVAGFEVSDPLIHPSRLVITVEDIMSPVLGTGITPLVVVNILRSAGEDFQVRDIVGGNYAYTSSFATSQMRVRNKEGPYMNICKGSDNIKKIYSVPEDNFTAIDLCRRWSYRSQAWSATGDINIPDITVYNTVLPDLFDYVRNLFRYTQGDMEFMAPVPPTDTPATYGVFTKPATVVVPSGITPDGNSQVSSGASYTISGLNPVLRFIAPLRSYTSFLETPACYSSLTLQKYCIPRTIELETTFNTSPAFAYVRAGPNMQLFHLQPPLNLGNLYVSPPIADFKKRSDASNIRHL